jgi:hypothetical protein
MYLKVFPFSMDKQDPPRCLFFPTLFFRLDPYKNLRREGCSQKIKAPSKNINIFLILANKQIFNSNSTELDF